MKFSKLKICQTSIWRDFCFLLLRATLEEPQADYAWTQKVLLEEWVKKEKVWKELETYFSSVLVHALVDNSICAFS